MEEDTPLQLWEDGVLLRFAWWVFAEPAQKVRFRELQRESRHYGYQQYLESEVIARISSKELQAFGIEYGSNAGPISIRHTYFDKWAKVDFDEETVEALGRKFGQVRVQGKREPIHEALSEEDEIDRLRLPVELIPEAPAPLDEHVIYNKETEETPTDTTPDELVEERKGGRPSKTPEIEQAIDILLRNGVDLASMPRRKAYRAVRDCAAKELNSNIEIGFSDPVIQRSLFKRFGRRQ